LNILLPKGILLGRSNAEFSSDFPDNLFFSAKGLRNCGKEPAIKTP
jgi:hypothetical protein